MTKETNDGFIPRPEVFEIAADILPCSLFSCTAVEDVELFLALGSFPHLRIYERCHKPSGAGRFWLTPFFDENPHIDPYLFRKTLLLEMALNIKEQLEG